jgi:hypothetical protein
VAEFFQDYPEGFNLVDIDETIRRRTVGLAQALKGVSLSALDLLHLSTPSRSNLSSRRPRWFSPPSTRPC